MENVIHKIFLGNNDADVHDEFLKFGRGSFGNKYLIEAKRQKDKWAVKTSAEFANYFVKRMLEGASEVSIKGAIICTMDLREETDIEIERVKQFMGVKQFIVNCTTEASKILELMVKEPRAFYALSFSTPKGDLKIKAKAPKSAKPSSKGDKGPKADFCSLKTTDESLVKDLIFDFPDFKEIKINHTLQIDEVLFPEGVEDPKEVREKARKKGKIIREVEIDGREEKSEKEFEA